MLVRLPLASVLTVVLLAVLGLGWLFLARKSRLVLGPVAGIGARQLQAFLGVRTEIGGVSGDPLKGITVEWLVLGRDAKLPTGATISVDDLRVRYRLWAMVRRTPPVEAIDSVRVRGVKVFVHRSAQGKWNLAELVPKRKKKRPKKPSRFAGEVWVENVQVHFQDDTVSRARGGPFTGRFDLKQLTADFSKHPRVAFKLTGGCPDGALSSLETEGSANLEQLAVEASFAAVGLDLPTWARLAPLPEGTRLTDGVAALSGSVELSRHENVLEVKYEAGLSLADFSLFTRGVKAPLSGEWVRLASRGTVTSESRDGGGNQPVGPGGKPLAPPASTQPEIRAAGPKTTVCGTATVDGVLEEVGKVAVTAAFDTDKGVADGTARVGDVSCRHWLDALGANNGARLTAGSARLDTQWRANFPAGEDPRVRANGTLRFTGGSLHPAALHRPLSGLSSIVDYAVDVKLGDRTAVSGDVTARGGLQGFPHYEVRCAFDTRKSPLRAHLRLSEAEVLAIPALLGESRTFHPHAGRLGADMDFLVDLRSRPKALGYDGQVRVSGLSGQLKKTRRPFRPIDLDLNVKGSAPLRGPGAISTKIASRRRLPRLGALAATVDYFKDTHGVGLEINADDVDVPFWSEMVLPLDRVSVLEGRADTVFTLVTKPRLQYEARGSFRDLVVRLPQIRRNAKQVSGEYHVVRDNVELTDVTTAVDSSFFVTNGEVRNFRSPTLDLKVRGERLNLAQLLQLAPDPEILPRVEATESAVGQFAVTGAVSAVNVTGTVEVPQAAVEYRDYGVFGVQPLSVSVSVEGVRTKAPLLDLKAKDARVDLAGLNRKLLGARGEEFTFPKPATVSFQVQGTPKQPQVDAQVSVPSVLVGDRRLTDLSAGVNYCGKVITLADAVGHVGKGTVTTAGTVQRAEDTVYVDLHGDLTGVDLRLAQPWLTERGLTLAGDATGPYTLRGLPNDLEVGGTFALADVDLVQQVEPQKEAVRHFQVASGQAKVALRADTSGERLATAGTVEVSVAPLEMRLPRKTSDTELVVVLDRAESLLVLTPKTITTERVEVEAYGGRAVLTDIRYDPEAGKLVAHAVASGVELASLKDLSKRDDLSGTGGFVGELRVSPEGPVLTGQATLTSFCVAQAPECGVSAELALAWPELTLSHAEVQFLGCRAEVTGSARAPDDENDAGRLELRLKGAGPLRQVADAYLPRNTPAEGKLTLSATVSGTFKSPDVAADVRIADGTLKGIPVTRFEARGTMRGDTGRLDTLEMTLGGAELRASGEMKPGRKLALEFVADPVPLALALRMADLEGPAQGFFRARGSVTGTPDNPLVSATVDSADLSLGQTDLGELHGSVSYQQQGVHLSPLTWRLNGGSLTAAGRVPVSSPEDKEKPAPADLLDCTVVWEKLTFGELHRLGEEVSMLLGNNEQPAQSLDDTLFYFRKLKRLPEGVLAGRAVLRGALTDPQVPEALLTVTGGKIGDEPLPEFTLEAAYGDRKVFCRSLRAELGDMRAEVTGDVGLDGETALDVEIRNFPLALVNPWARGMPEVSGLGDLFARASGPTKSPRVEGSLEITEPALQNAAFDRLRLNYFRLEDGAFTIDPDDLTLIEDENILSAGCRLPVSYKGAPIPRDKPFTAAARLRGEDLGLLSGLFPAVPRMLGQLEAEVAAVGTLDQPQFTGRVVVDDTNVELPGLESNLHGLTGEIRLESGRRVVFQDMTAMLSAAPVDTTLLPQFRHKALKLSGNVVLTDEGLRHPLANLFDLLLEMDSLELKLKDTSPLTEVKSRVTLKTRQSDGRAVIAVEDFTGTGNNRSGPLRAHGTVILAPNAFGSLKDFNRSDVALSVSAKNLTLSRAPYGTFTFDTDLQFAGDPLHDGMPVLRGGVLVHDTRLSTPKLKPSTEAPGPLPSFPFVDIYVTVGDRVEVVHPALRASLEGGLQISGSPADILVSGGLSSDRGVLQLPHAKAQLRRAEVDIFVRNDPVIRQQLVTRVWVDADASAEVDEYLIDIKMRGPLALVEGADSELELRMTSQPSLSQEEIYALLIGTSSRTGGSAASFQEDLRAQFEKQLIGLFASQASDVLTRQLRQALGLDKLDLIWGDEGVQEIAFGKRFGKLSVGVRRLFNQSSLDTAFQAEYRFSRRFSVEYERDEFDSSQLRLKFRFSFGT
jgi:autotransporter translocation and assembly factor TamB